MFYSIKSKIFLSHLFLIVLLLGGLSYRHYVDVLENYINSTITFYTNYSTSIVTTSSLAISGANYGNIQLPSFIEEVSKNKNLLYLNISGFSDYTSKKFNAVYDKKYKTIYRNKYPENYEQQLNQELKNFLSKLNDASSDKVKINFLIERIKDKLKQYKQNTHYTKKLNHKYVQLMTHEPPYMDYNKDLLYISLKTDNKNGGKVSMVFDISKISDIKSKILKDILIETFVALLISVIVLNILSNKIVDPLNKLSAYMSNDFQHLNSNKIPGLELKDEIGTLSHTFKKLLEAIQMEHKKTEKKAHFDSLTEIYNRYKFNEILVEEFKRSQRYSNNFSIAIIDIDKFKNVNDTYGHLIGDEILIMIAQAVNNKARSTDVLARWGGEEFVILFKETPIDVAKILAERLKDEIQKLHHDIAGGITASFGATQYKEDDTLKSVFKRCDDALYKAKENGRNRVEVL